MDNQNIDYHLKQAVNHLEIALMKSKDLIDHENTKQEISEKWEEFLAYMFGYHEKTRGIL